MDKSTGALFLMVLLLFGGLLYVIYNQGIPTGGPQTIEVKTVEKLYPTSQWTYTIKLVEGVGPNQGTYLDGTVTIYKTPIEDVYNIPADAVVAAQASIDVNNAANGVQIILSIDETFKERDNENIYVWIVGESNNHYKAMLKDAIPVQSTKDDMTYNNVRTLVLDKVATLTWSADDAYRGTDSPVLRYKTTEEVYKSIFVIKPSIDFTTDRPSGIFIVKKASIAADVNADLTNVDTITVVFNDTPVFDAVAAADLPENYTYAEYLNITPDAPLTVVVTVTTIDGTASLTAGSPLLLITLEDVLGNTYSVPVKVA